MVFGGFDPSGYEPKWPGVHELNIGDEWRARWSDADELPGGAPIFYGYALVAVGDKGYVTRRKGEAEYGIAEGTFVEGEQPEAFAARLAAEQVGALEPRVELIGYLDCKATSYNPDFPPGANTVRPIYLVSGKRIEDLGEASPFERRRLPLNEFAKAVRDRHPDLYRYLQKAVDRHTILHLRGEA
jgi:hypothetical protein